MSIATPTPEDFHRAAALQRVCAVCGKAKGRPDYRGRTWHAHHVVAREWLKRNHKLQWTPANALRLCTDCHMGHETGGPGKVEIELSMLTDDNIAYVEEIMGAGPAYDYLKRYYTGFDVRVEVGVLGRYMYQKTMADMAEALGTDARAG